MLVVVPLTFDGAGVTDAGAQLQRLAEHLLVRPRPPRRELAGRLAYVRAIEAGPDALAHVHLLGCAGVGAAKTHARAVHQMVRGIGQRLVDVTLNVGVQADHLANGHKGLLIPVENRRAASRFLL